MRKRTVRALGVGLALTLAACGDDRRLATNPPPIPEPVAPPGNPPTPSLPTWDEAKSGHPEGATNPPIPVLAVSADGSRCWKEWFGPKSEQTPDHMDRVLAVGATSGGTEVVCPPQAKELLDNKGPAQP